MSSSLQRSSLARTGQKVYERLWVAAKRLQGRAKIIVSFYQVAVAVPGTYLVSRVCFPTSVNRAPVRPPPSQRGLRPGSSGGQPDRPLAAHATRLPAHLTTHCIVRRPRQITFPETTDNVVSSFKLLNLDLGGLGFPLACFGLDRIRNRLLYSILTPCAVIVGTYALFALKGAPPAKDGQPQSSRFHDALPVVLYVSFLVAPAVSSQAFRAFSCDCFHLNATHGKVRAPPTRLCPRSPSLLGRSVRLVGTVLPSVRSQHAACAYSPCAQCAAPTKAPLAFRRPTWPPT